MVADSSEERQLISKGYSYIAGVDETGVGSLAGEVYMAAVVFAPGFDFSILKGVNDSKQMTEAKRDSLYELIKKHALAYSVATASVEEINVHNIYWAKFIAARRALDQLSIKPDFVLMDGNAEIPDIDIPQKAIVKGDSKSISIAAASILAKVERDRYIVKLASQVHEDYGWADNKAYYTPNHIKALQKHGKTQWHRDKYVSKFIGENK